MIGVRFDPSAHPEGTLERLAAGVEKAMEDGDFVQAINDLFARIQVRHTIVDVVNDESALRQQALYYLMTLYISLGWEERADAIAEVIGPIAVDYPMLIHEQHFHLTGIEARRQADAIGRGIPSIFIVSLPKSASATVTNGLRELLRLASVSLKWSERMRRHLVANFMRGGCITHGHYIPDEANLSIIRNSALHTLFLQIRDPRQAAWSMHHHLRRTQASGESSDVGMEAEVLRHFERWCDWLKAWSAFARDPESDCEVHLIQYDDVRTDLGAVLMQVAAAIGVPELKAVERRWYEIKSRVAYRNFRSGDPNEWRSALSAATREAMYDRTPQEVRRLFREYEP